MKYGAIRRKLAKVDRAIDKAIEAAETPGAVVLARMRKGGETLEYLGVRGSAVVRPERVPMARDTIFDLASLTKVMATATALLLLSEEGAVGLDDPVAKHLPAFAEREKEGVTVRHLLTHSSGLRPWRGFHEPLLERERKKGERIVATPAAKEWVLQSIYRSALVHEPGSAAVYGDLDYITLGALIEAVSRQPLERFCEERVFRPLGLAQTAFVPVGEGAPPLPEALRRRFAATENCPWRGRIVWGEVHDPNACGDGRRRRARGPLRARRRRDALRRGAGSTSGTAAALAAAVRGRAPLRRRARACPRAPTGRSAGTRRRRAPPRRASTSRRTSIGHLGFTGTSLWIDLERRGRSS